MTYVIAYPTANYLILMFHTIFHVEIGDFCNFYRWKHPLHPTQVTKHALPVSTTGRVIAIVNWVHSLASHIMHACTFLVFTLIINNHYQHSYGPSFSYVCMLYGIMYDKMNVGVIANNALPLLSLYDCCDTSKYRENSSATLKNGTWTAKAYYCSPIYWHRLSSIPGWISTHMISKVWDEIIYPIPNFNGCTVEVWEWINNFILHIIADVITYPCWD